MSMTKCFTFLISSLRSISVLSELHWVKTVMNRRVILRGWWSLELRKWNMTSDFSFFCLFIRSFTQSLVHMKPLLCAWYWGGILTQSGLHSFSQDLRLEPLPYAFFTRWLEKMFNKWLTLNFKGEPLLPVGVIRDKFMESSDWNWVFKGK